MNRREFLQTGSAVSGMLLINSRTAFGYEANSAVRHGLLGCGNRGSSVAESFARNTLARIVALGDPTPPGIADLQTRLQRRSEFCRQRGAGDRLARFGFKSPDVDVLAGKDATVDRHRQRDGDRQ